MSDPPTPCGEWEIARSYSKVQIEARGYPAPTEIVAKLSVLGAKIGEDAVRRVERSGGLSKLRPFRTAMNFLKFLVYLKLKINLYQNKVLHSL